MKGGAWDGVEVVMWICVGWGLCLKVVGVVCEGLVRVGLLWLVEVVDGTSWFVDDVCPS